MTYARNTTVSAMRTRNEIEETLERYGADGFAYDTQGNLATVIFAMENRRIRFVLELPDPEEFRHTNHLPYGLRRRNRGVRCQCNKKGLSRGGGENNQEVRLGQVGSGSSHSPALERKDTGSREITSWQPQRSSRC